MRIIFMAVALLMIVYLYPMLITDTLTTGTEDSIPFSTKQSTEQDFYKWQDREGVWHYSDEPHDSEVVEVITVDTKTNLIQGLHSKKLTDAAGEKSLGLESSKPVTSVSNKPTDETTNRIKKILDEAREVQTLMDMRNEKIKQATTN